MSVRSVLTHTRHPALAAPRARDRGARRGTSGYASSGSCSQGCSCTSACAPRRAARPRSREAHARSRRAPRADARDRARGRSAGADPRPPRARHARELGLHLGPLAADRGQRRLALPAPARGLPSDAHRDLRLGRDRHDHLPRLSRRAAAPDRDRPHGHRDELLARLPRAAAAVADGSLRGAAEPALRLGSARRADARALPSAHARCASSGRSCRSRWGSRS